MLAMFALSSVFPGLTKQGHSTGPEDSSGALTLIDPEPREEVDHSMRVATRVASGKDGSHDLLCSGNTRI